MLNTICDLIPYYDPISIRYDTSRDPTATASRSLQRLRRAVASTSCFTRTHTHTDTLAHLHTAIKNNELLLMGNMLITNCGWNSLLVVVVAFVTSFFSDLYFWLTFFWDLWRFVKLHVTIQTVVVSVAAVGKFVECGFYCCFWRWHWRNQRLFCCVCLRFVLCVIHKKKAQNGKNIFPWKSVRRWEKYV